MSVRFNPKHGPIVIEAEVTGPARSLTLELILDTGATNGLLREAVVLALKDVERSFEAAVQSGHFASAADAVATAGPSFQPGLACNRGLPSPIAMGSQVYRLRSKSAKRMGTRREMHAQ